MAETIEYIIHQIYIEKKIPPICSKLIFKRLLIKLTTECPFQFNHQLLKQVEGCTMGGPLSVYSCRNLYDKDGKCCHATETNIL